MQLSVKLVFFICQEQLKKFKNERLTKCHRDDGVFSGMFTDFTPFSVDGLVENLTPQNPAPQLVPQQAALPL